MVADPSLNTRLAKAKLERLFEQHMREVFGDRHADLSPSLRSSLRELWLLGVETKTDADMASREPEESLRRPLSRMNDVEFVAVARSAMKKAIRDVEQRGLPLPEEAPRLAPEALPRKTYPATVGRWSPEWPASSERDTSRPACPSCGGRGLGDYPYACSTCGGSGNG